MTAEQLELMRIAAQRVVDDHASGARNDPHALAWAQQIVRTTPPLGRPLGTGEPALETLPPALRGNALEVF